MAKLRRDLGLFEATTVVVGTMIGSGIFLGPERIATLLADPFLMVLVWAFTGLLILFAALTYAELGSIFPQSGGDYAYLREAYGPLVGFFNGWSVVNFGKGASLAAVAVGAATYATAFLPIEGWGEKVFAVGLIAALALVNVLGVRHAGRLSNVLAGAKIAGIGGLILIGLFYAGAPPAAPGPALRAPAGLDLVAAFGVAMVPALFAYDGWSVSTQVAEEIRDPQRTLPKSLIVSVLVVATLYILANLAYLKVLGIGGIAGSEFAAADTAGLVFGDTGRTLMALAVLLSIVGTANAITVTGPRVSYAMGRDGVFPARFGTVTRWGTPGFAIVVQAAYAAVFAIALDFDTLLNALVFAGWIFYGLAGASVIVLRLKRPELPRPYKVPLYPWVPLAFVGLSAFFVVNTLTQIPVESGLGLLLLALGYPVYALARRKWQTVVPAREWRALVEAERPR
ncbi:MAG TPA: amino acid permease [Candidatus Thermoplasmatota archaeon]|nr:amino acid permease [Candidatus Thermoplasmatota archaeon]